MPWRQFTTQHVDRHEISKPSIFVAVVPNPEDKPVKDVRNQRGESIRPIAVHYVDVSNSVELVFDEYFEGGEVAL